MDDEANASARLLTGLNRDRPEPRQSGWLVLNRRYERRPLQLDPLAGSVPGAQRRW
jgi:hypothetical protein